jgi:hypothetical protein
MIYESNIGGTVDSITARLNSLKTLDMMLREIATTIYANNIRRIHNKGLAVNESRIGNYSTKPTLIGAKSFTTKAAANKAFALIKREQKAASKNVKGASKWVTVKGKHLAELSGGYKQIRQLEGKATSVVNLNRTGTLQDDLIVDKSGKDYIIGFRTEYGKKLKGYMEDYFAKKIWGATKKDKEVALAIANKYIKKATNATS